MQGSVCNGCGRKIPPGSSRIWTSASPISFLPPASLTSSIRRVNYHFIITAAASTSAQQLQPVPDNSNPLYIIMGNPDLQPAFSHNFSMSLRQTKGTFYWYTAVNFSTTSNMIITETYFDELRRQVSRPLNMNGNYSTSGNATVSKTWKSKDFTFRMNSSLGGSYNRNMSRIDKQNIESKTYGVNAETVPDRHLQRLAQPDAILFRPVQ